MVEMTLAFVAGVNAGFALACALVGAWRGFASAALGAMAGVAFLFVAGGY